MDSTLVEGVIAARVSAKEVARELSRALRLVKIECSMEGGVYVLSSPRRDDPGQHCSILLRPQGEGGPFMVEICCPVSMVETAEQALSSSSLFDALRPPESNRVIMRRVTAYARRRQAAEVVIEEGVAARKAEDQAVASPDSQGEQIECVPPVLIQAGPVWKQTMHVQFTEQSDMYMSFLVFEALLQECGIPYGDQLLFRFAALLSSSTPATFTRGKALQIVFPISVPDTPYIGIVIQGNQDMLDRARVFLEQHCYRAFAAGDTAVLNRIVRSVDWDVLECFASSWEDTLVQEMEQRWTTKRSSVTLSQEDTRIELQGRKDGLKTNLCIRDLVQALPLGPSQATYTVLQANIGPDTSLMHLQYRLASPLVEPEDQPLIDLFVIVKVRSWCGGRHSIVFRSVDCLAAPSPHQWTIERPSGFLYSASGELCYRYSASAASHNEIHSAKTAYTVLKAKKASLVVAVDHWLDHLKQE